MKKALLLIPLFLVLDQLSKLFFPVTRNPGSAFGLFQGKTLLFIIAAVLVLILAFTQLKDRKLQFPLILIISGAAGNLIDRLFLGYVRDFLCLGFWPCFNLADALLTMGFLWLALLLLKKPRKP